MDFVARYKIFLIGIVLSFASLWMVNSLIITNRSKTLIAEILSGFLVFLSGGAALMSFHIAAQKCSKYVTTTELVKLYFFGLFFQLFGKYRRNQFENASKNPRITQEKILLYILRKNAKTEYGSKLGLVRISTVDEFRKRHILSRYEQFEDYIERTAKGEDNVLLPTRPVQLVLTSGTTGKPKMIPLSAERKIHLPLTGLSLFINILFDNYPSRSLTQKMSTIYTHPTEYWSEAGILKSALSRIAQEDIQSVFCSPAAGYRISTEKEAMYVHAIFALKDETLGEIQALFCTFICNFFKLIETNWRDIVQDIANGTIKADLNIPSDVRSELNSVLKPDPIRADELRQAFERGFDGIARRIWPHMTCLYAVDSPALQLYADMLEKKYAKDVPLYSCFYISSEGLLGINLWPNIQKHKYHYVLVTNLTFFEFIPLENSQEDQPQTLLIDEVKEGESYELVITNIDGLYRFRFGDVVKVVGFYNKSPIIEVQFRIGDLMNLRGEKTSEDCIQRAISDTVASWECDLVDYTCAESRLVEAVEGTKQPASVSYYVIFAEIQSKPKHNGNVSKEKARGEKDKFDTILRNQVPMYDYYRKMDSLGQARLILVQSGSFEALRDYIIQNSTASPMQFKMPRKLRKKEWVELLLKHSYDSSS